MEGTSNAEELQGDTVKLEDIYKTFCGKSEALDSRGWVKLLKDTKVIDGKQFTTTDADLIFSKVKGGKRLDFEKFQKALQLVETRKKISHDNLMAIILSTEGPKYTGTKAEPNRFHDDKNMYTGVHAHGGPSTLDIRSGPKSQGLFSEYEPNPSHSSGTTVRLENLLDRSKPNVRGVNPSMVKEKP